MSPAARFVASYDWTTKIVSAATVFILLIPLFVAPLGQWIALAAIVLLLAAYAYSPCDYAIADGTLVVRRWIGDIRIPLGEIVSCRKSTKEDFAGCLRLWGSGGLFGYYGLFRTSRLGKCTWYMTHRSNAVVIQTAAKTILLSPDDVEGFLATLGAPCLETVCAPVKVSRTPLYVGIVLGALTAGLTIAIVVWAFSYAPGPPAVTLTQDSLTIHDRFYPLVVRADSIDLNQVRVMDFRTDTQWRPAMRTGGFANSHYRSGHFRTAGGRKVELYIAEGTRPVLLPPRGDGVPVIYGAAEPEQFIGTLRQQWNR